MAYCELFQGADCRILVDIIYPARGILDFDGGIFYFDEYPDLDYFVGLRIGREICRIKAE
jgi:hypothetical protein